MMKILLKKMRALINREKGYQKIEYNDLGAEFLTNEDFSNINEVSIQNRNIIAYIEFDVSRLFDLFKGENETTLKFQYLQDDLRLMDLVTTGEIRYIDKVAHIFYNVNEGQVYYNYLAKPEKIGKPEGYYYNWYSRVMASEIDDIKINAKKDKGQFLSRKYPLKNNPVGNPVTYGFENWRSHRDLSAEYFVAHEWKNIYLLVEVIDDEFVVSDSDESDQQEKIVSSFSLVWGEERSLGEIIWLNEKRD